MAELKGSYSTKERLGDDGKPYVIEVSKDVPETVDGWVDQYGEELTLALIRGEAGVRLGTAVRDSLKADKSDDEIHTLVEHYDFAPKGRASTAEISSLRAKDADMKKVNAGDMTMEEFFEKWSE